MRRAKSGQVDVKSGLVLARTETRPDHSTQCPDENPYGSVAYFCWLDVETTWTMYNKDAAS